MMVRRLVVMLALGVALGVALERPAAWAEDARQSALDLLAQARTAFTRRPIAARQLLAVELYEKAIAAAPTYEALWEGARAAAELGYNGWKKQPSSKRAALFKKGLAWARRATEVRPDGAEGHYFTAVLLGLWAEQRSFVQQAATAGDIRRAAERAYKLNPRIECGAPARLLGIYYRKVPAVFGGDDRRAVKLLDEALRYCPDDPRLHYDLAECLEHAGQEARAREEARWVLDHLPADRHEKAGYDTLERQATELLEKLR